eukprot:TRINITY_DN78880_c0_g1_i1.p1 TRINITY_DN78880_c0_g1~~TRINITY_DN78880_c0_g1_i1.p1  ORF type:complete len:520 (-),score=96.74 TRINITY_DN78880_c0_g1_i1:33-1532(-)
MACARMPLAACALAFLLMPLAERTALTDLEKSVEDELPPQQRAGIEGRLETLQESLTPLYGALPKNENGELGFAAVRYALYRLFRQSHAWLVKGLTPAGQPWNASHSLSDALQQNKVPAHVDALFKDHLDKSGFNLQELAFLAATLEEIIFEEQIAKLKQAYTVLELPLTEAVPWESVSSALEVYMIMYIMGKTGDQLVTEDERTNVKAVYPNWPATQRFIKKLMREATHKASGDLLFTEAEHIVTQMAARYGHWQDIECRELKHTLLAMETQCQGRVELGDFHGSSVGDGKWQFSETEEYLRSLGALDESNDQHPSVIVPNYIDSPSNYVADSETFSIVCLDECLTLMSHIERAIAAPFAPPTRIANLVKTLTSSSIPEPRALPDYLLRRLDSIAKMHGGRVPLHGRLFAQWMHHAYPRECQFPFSSGETKPMLPSEFANTEGPVLASPEEMEANEKAMHEVHKEVPLLHKIHENCLPWTMQEELLTELPALDPSGEL